MLASSFCLGRHYNMPLILLFSKYIFRNGKLKTELCKHFFETFRVFNVSFAIEDDLSV